MTAKHKSNAQQKALIQTVIVLSIFSLAGIATIFWARQDIDSPIAKQIRSLLGIQPNAPEVVVAPKPAPEPVVIVEAEPEPKPEVVTVVTPPPPPPEPEPLPKMSWRELAGRTDLWPDTLQLAHSKKVEIRYGENTYGHVEFITGSIVVVEGLYPTGEVLGSVNGNSMSLAPDETNLIAWFEAIHGQNYELQADSRESFALDDSIAPITTKEGQTEFWNELKLWCHTNYDSTLIESGPESLVFRWLPKEEVPIDFRLEAREIARIYLLKRAARGGHDNYASCEIRHPRTGELLGTGSIFIPRL